MVIKKEHNCPNCAAPVTDYICPYCGTAFIDFASIDNEKPCYIRMKYDNHIVEAKVILDSMSITQHDYEPTMYVLHDPCLYISKQPQCDIDISMHTISMDDGAILKHYRLE